MTYLDISIVSIYLLYIIWKGVRMRNDHKTTEEFFLAGRSISWPLVGLSLYATNISIATIIGLSSSGYKTGISVFNYEWMGTIMLLVFAVFIVPYYLKHKLITMPEFLGRRFDNRSRYFFSVLSIAMSVLIDIAGAIYVGSILLKGIFPETELYIFIIVTATITGLYTIAGGLKGVIITDSIQAVLLTLGSVIVAWVVFQQVESWQEVRNTVGSDFLSLIQPADDPFIPWPTLLVSLPILSFYFMCSNQHMVQRVLGAKTLEDGRKGAIFAGLLKLPLLFLLVLPGTLGLLLYPGLDNPNLIYGELMYTLIPEGVLGIILTGFVAALMSSIDSALTASSSIATMDLYSKFRPGASQKALVKMGKIFIVIAVVLASVWAPFIERFPTLWEYLQAVLSYLSPPIVVSFLFGLFWKGATADGAFYSLIGGSSLAVLLIVNNYIFQMFTPVHFLYSATLIFLFSSMLMLIFGLVKPDQEVSEFFLSTKKHIAEVNQVWYKNYRTYALVVLALTVVLVISFW